MTYVLRDRRLPQVRSWYYYTIGVWKAAKGGILIWHFMSGQFLTFDPWKVREVVSFEEVAGSLICLPFLDANKYPLTFVAPWFGQMRCFFSNAWNWSFHGERPLARKDWKVMNTPRMIKMKFTSKDRNICCTQHHQITFQSILAFFVFTWSY